MTLEEIAEVKQKKFLQRSKERLFGLVDNLDYLSKVGQASLPGFSTHEDPA